MWFKYEDKLTSIYPTDKYNVYTNSKPSLTIKAVDFTDLGRYVCVVVDGQGKVESIGFKLRVIPQEEIYNQMLKHRNDKTYVRTDDINKVNMCLQKHGTVVLTGRAGTGKSKLCLEIASLCEKFDYLPYVVDLSSNSLEDFGPSKILCIIDCNGYNSQDLEQLKTLLRDIESRENVQMLITSRSTDLINVQTILQESSLLNEGNMIDLNESLTSREKKEILNKHMEANNITESSLKESNLKEILKNNVIQVKIDTETIEEIIKTEPLHGFPQTAVKFCNERKLLHLGKRYFTNLPKELESEINELAKIKDPTESALDAKIEDHTGYKLDGKMKYCVLAYIATDEKKCLEIRDISTKRFTELCRVLYKKTNIDKVDVMSKIKDAIKDLGQFVIQDGGKYEFIHPYVLTTIYASHEHFTDHIIEKGSLSEIKELIRSSKYKFEEGEMVCKRSGLTMYNHLCSRLLTDASKDGDSAKDVGMYIYKQFIKLKDDEFLDAFISDLKSRIYNEKSPPAKRNKVPKTIMRKADFEEQIYLYPTFKGPKVSFWQTVLLVDELTDHGKDSWVPLQKMDKSAELAEESWNYPDIILLCGLIVTCQEERQDGEYKKYLMMQLKLKFYHEHDQFLKTLIQRVDIYGNTFFHYLVILMEEESHSILEMMLSKEGIFSKDKPLPKEKYSSIFGQTNKMNLTPLDMAAFLGKLKLFLLLRVNTKQEVINKNKEHLYKLTEEGRMTAKDKEDKRMSLNFEEGLLKYIQYGTEKDFLDILDLHKKT